MFTCPSCQKETKTLVVNKMGLGCRACLIRNSNASVALHVNAGLKGEAKNLTEADKKHFLNRAMGPDGQTCVHKDNPSKRWNF